MVRFLSGTPKLHLRQVGKGEFYKESVCVMAITKGSGNGQSNGQIRINRIPNGIADEGIRSAWVGLVLPLVAEVPEEMQHARQKGFFVVAKDAAIEVLRKSGKIFAVAYWQTHCGSGFFCFRPEHCEEVAS